jgi:hypothetical protein
LNVSDDAEDLGLSAPDSEVLGVDLVHALQEATKRLSYLLLLEQQESSTSTKQSSTTQSSTSHQTATSPPAPAESSVNGDDKRRRQHPLRSILQQFGVVFRSLYGAAIAKAATSTSLPAWSNLNP